MRASGFASLGVNEVVLSAYHVTDSSSTDDLCAHIKCLGLSSASGVVVLTDGSLPDLVERLGDVFCVNRFAPLAHGKNPANVLTSVLAKCLRTYRYFSKRFEDQKYHQILRLPLKNFNARETGDMRRACHEMMNRDNFGRELDQILHLMRQRQHPKKASSYRDIYLVDDNRKHFCLGHEVHARAETACPPHNLLCLLRNAFRFGRAFDGLKHFNVSYDGNDRMNGEYIDCHNLPRSGRGAAHLNMFTNDFF
jgi:hypothetical protein